MDQVARANLELGNYLFETMLVQNGKVKALLFHRKRVEKSHKYLGYPEMPEWEIELKRRVMSTLEMARCKMLVIPGKEKCSIRFSLTTFRPLPCNYDFRLSLNHHWIRSSRDPFLQLKMGSWGRNAYYLHLLDRLRSGIDDLIFFNEKEEVCETCRFNLYFQYKNTLLTPPLESGVLAGTYRARLLQKGSLPLEGEKLFIREAVIPLKTLEKRSLYSQIYVSNALHGLRRAIRIL